jgi:hypothetical protein
VRDIMPGMDSKTLQPSIDALNAEIQRLTSARDTLQALTSGPGVSKQKQPTKSNARSIAQRKRWAEQKTEATGERRQGQKLRLEPLDFLLGRLYLGGLFFLSFLDNFLEAWAVVKRVPGLIQVEGTDPITVRLLQVIATGTVAH